MGTKSIDTMQSEDIEQLQTDVSELETKLNALIVEFNKCSDDTTTNKGKIDSLITDMGSATTLVNTLRTDLLDVQDLITKDENSGTYSEPGSPSDRGILAKLKRLEDKCSLIMLYGLTYDNNDGFLHTKLISNPQTSSVSGDDPSSGISITSTSALGTPTSGTGDDTSVNASPASVQATYTSAPSKVITVGTKGEIRARKLARQTLNRLRK